MHISPRRQLLHPLSADQTPGSGCPYISLWHSIFIQKWLLIKVSGEDLSHNIGTFCTTFGSKVAAKEFYKILLEINNHVSVLVNLPVKRNLLPYGQEVIFEGVCALPARFTLVVAHHLSPIIPEGAVRHPPILECHVGVRIPPQCILPVFILLISANALWVQFISVHLH